MNLRDLLLHAVEDLYSAEEQIIEALPLMVQNASDRELKKALNEHLKVTKEQKRRLDKVKKLLGAETNEQKGFLARMFGSGGEKCKGVEGLITEGNKMMSEDMEPKVMDAAIIASAQKIEHYEISGYGTARAFAVELNLSEVARLLEATLQEEYKADTDLNTLALGKINVEAEGGSSNPGPKKFTPRKGQSAPAKKHGVIKAKSAGGRKTASKKAAPKRGTKKATKRATR